MLEEVIRDTEQLTLEEEEEVEPIEEKGEEEKAGGGQGAEPGSPAALLDEFITRSGVYCCYGNQNNYCCYGNVTMETVTMENIAVEIIMVLVYVTMATNR